MPNFEVGDVVVVTGPLKLPRSTIEQSSVSLIPGEVAKVVKTTQDPTHGACVQVIGEESGQPGPDPNVGNYAYWIDPASLTLFSEIAEDPRTQWGEPGDPDYVRYLGAHDYVYSEGEE